MKKLHVRGVWLALLLVLGACGDDSAGNEPGAGSDAAASGNDASISNAGGGSGNSGGAANGGGAAGTGGESGSQLGDGAVVDVRSMSDANMGPITIAAGQGKPTGIALSANLVYWADEPNGTIVSCPKTGCVGAPAVVVASTPSPRGIALRGSTLFWVTGAQPDSGSPQATKRCTLGACGAAQIVDMGIMSGGPLGNVAIAADDHRVYVSGGPQVITCPVDGCGDAGLTRLGVTAGPIFGVAVGPATLYLARPLRGVARCPLSGCSSIEDETSLAVVPGPFAMAVDSNNIYWSEYPYFVGAAPPNDAAIRTCPLAGCDVSSAKVLATGRAWPYAIAVDDSNVFYTDAGNGRVERTPKNDFSHQCVADHYRVCEACAGVIKCDGTCSSACIDASAD